MLNELQNTNILKTDEIRLDIKSLEKSVWNKNILSGAITFSVLPGEFVGLLGPSGSGKSTLLKSCCGLQKPTKGEVLFNGKELYKNQNLFRERIGYVPQDDIIHQELSVRKAIDYSAMLRLPPDMTSERRKALVQKVILEVGLNERADVKIKKLSGGQRKRASVAVELLNRPSILYLDEPTSGQDPQLEEAMMKLFQQIAKSGTGVIITTHAMASIELLDLIAILQNGKLVYFGPPQETLNFFETKSYEGIFKKLAEKNSDYWQQKFRNSFLYNTFIINRFREYKNI